MPGPPGEGRVAPELATKIQESPEVANSTWAATVTWDGGFRSSPKVSDFDPVSSDEPAGLGNSETWGRAVV